MKLYFSPGACSLATHITLLETGHEFELEKVDLRAKTHSGGDFRVINPHGYVPVLELDSGERLFESAVILQYIADKDGKLLPKAGTIERIRVLEWLNYVATEIHKGYSLWFGAGRLVQDAEGNRQLKASAREGMITKIQFIAKKLGASDYLYGNQITIADLYLWVCLRWSKLLEIDLNQWPEITKYMDRIKERPMSQKALAAEFPKA